MNCAHSVQCSGKGTHKCCWYFYRIWFFFTLLCSSPLPRIPLEIIRYHAETPSYKLNCEERKQLDDDVSVAEVEQAACALEQSPRSQRTFYWNIWIAPACFGKFPNSEVEWITHTSFIYAVSSVNSHVLRNMIRITKVVSPAEPSHYAVLILNCFLNYNSFQFCSLRLNCFHMGRTWLTQWKTSIIAHYMLY